ncbi:hypothetical protein LTR86_000019 [Recurvomyces mirabilis]|nr:hypothetical protein LTR86_000019 [Recurvomyces mirabilis]
MRPISFFLLLAGTGTSIAQNIATVTQVVTVPDASPTSTSLQQVKQLQSTTSTGSDATTTVPTTFATSISSTATDMTSTSPTSTASYGSEPGASTNGVDTEAGASGSGPSFSISTGGLVAIIVIVAVVALFAIASLTLWLIAKRRQETMRSSLGRISRRITAPLTPRAPPGSSNRRTTVNRGQFAEPGRARGHKRGLKIEETEMEKGGGGGGGGVREINGKGKKGGWGQRLWGNDWR